MGIHVGIEEKNLVLNYDSKVKKLLHRLVIFLYEEGSYHSLEI